MTRRDQQVGVPIIGANYRPACGLCDLPPWEACACSFQSITAERNEEPDESAQLVLSWDE